MGRRCRCAADEQWQIHFLTGHLARNMNHFIQRRGNQTGQANHIRSFFLGRFQYLFGRHHHTQVNHIEVIALEHNTHDVLADVVHIAFDGRHDDLARLHHAAIFFIFDIGNQMGYRLLHYAG